MNLLIQFLRRPAIVHKWGVEDWNRFMPLARNARLLGRCLYLLEQHDLLGVVPSRLVDQLRGALNQTRYVQVQALRELRHVVRVLDREDIPPLVLKGVAYLVSGLPPSRWRNLSDIDLLVPKDDIVRAEQALGRDGWQPSGDFDAYDQHYYRDWMHEVPPLVHRQREIEVDLHHNLAPPVSRIQINAAKLWADSLLVSGPYGMVVRTLAPADMLLHNAIHLFMNDELRGGLRDVVDFRDLFEHFLAQDAAFEQLLLGRARALGCGRPLYYAVSTARDLLGLAPSAAFLAEVEVFAPAAPQARLMRWLIEQVMAPARLGLRRTAAANQLLFVRSHWVRMPPGMLFRHLVHKMVKAKKPALSAADLPG
ncbi:MAG: nucleotidyltransferase family protein [Chromatiaceae bacterium]|nr:nucleotidyltransferase family protein [Chromatiaceae bacterium]